MLDKWDYCLRKLFVLKSTNLKRAIGSVALLACLSLIYVRAPLSHLAPGSSVLLSHLTDPSLPVDHPTRADVQKLVRKMEVKDWAAVVRAFDAWPFAPEVSLFPALWTHSTYFSVVAYIPLYISLTCRLTI